MGRRLARTYVDEIAGVRTSWPHTFSVGRPSREEILADLRAVDALTQTLRAWEDAYGTTTEYRMREAGGPKRIPSHVTVPSLEVAALLAPPRKPQGWTHALARTRSRLALLAQRFPATDAATRAQVLRAQDDCDDLEFDLVLQAASWFLAHDAHGLMPRQVPIPGIDSKWLNNKRRQQLICLLAGRDALGLAQRPALLEFAYLDPEHLRRGGRHYDSWTQGDTTAVPYEPDLVVVVENKDTYLCFPALERGVCLFGSGFAGATLAAGLPWLARARRIVYWGDLDADGFEILNAYRANGIACESMLMDRATLERFGRFGTDLEKDHRTALVRQRKELPFLTPEERDAYLLLTSDGYRGHRRLEQERIPLGEALARLRGEALP